MKNINILKTLFLATTIILNTTIWANMLDKTTAPTNGNKPTILMFFNQQCPHCRSIERFIAKRNLDNLFIIDKKDVTQKENGQLLVGVLNKCKITKHVIDLPVIAAGDKCFTGENEVRNFFNEALRAQTKK